MSYVHMPLVEFNEKYYIASNSGLLIKFRSAPKMA